MSDTDKIIDKLEETRRRNNVNWMDLVRLAFRSSPDEAREIMKRICDADAEIMDVARELAGEKKPHILKSFPTIPYSDEGEDAINEFLYRIKKWHEEASKDLPK